VKKSESHIEDPDMVNSMKALVRAGKRARKLAEETGTRLVVVRDGRLIREKPQALTSTKRRSRKSKSS
jgi:hypothetical protein